MWCHRAVAPATVSAMLQAASSCGGIGWRRRVHVMRVIGSRENDVAVCGALGSNWAACHRLRMGRNTRDQQRTTHSLTCSLTCSLTKAAGSTATLVSS